jgi:hypothetical protein
MLMIMIWDVNACLTPRGVTSAGDISIRLLAYNINNFSHEVQETKLDCWQVKVGHHCICQIASVH